ncbi:MAG TPA: M20/M25/M40 family metallo-hydrolase [Pyrinomonadaceae bacterium]
MNIFELTRQLIDIPSVTGEEAEVALFLSGLLKSLGYEVWTQEVEADRVNLIASAGARRPRVMLSTHMDTVPPHIGSSEDEVYIYGRGSCDAKGIIAAQIVAAEMLRSEGVEDFGLLFTVDEEMSSLGARVLNDHPLAEGCRYLINGEPTDNKLAVGTKGSLRLTLGTEGRAAHSAYPDQGESAIEKLLDVLADVRSFDWPGDDVFGETTCNIGVIQGGAASNVIPANARAELFFRLAVPLAPVKESLERMTAGRAQIEYHSAVDPVRLLSLEGFETEVVRFMTDIPYLSNWGTPLLIGPGSILDAHTAHERVAKSELLKASELYVRLVRELLARAPGECGGSELKIAEGALG